MATRHRKMMVMPPTTASLLRTSRRHASRYRLEPRGLARSSAISPAGPPGNGRLVSDAGVDNAIQEIDGEVHDREERTVEQDHGHDHRIVTARHGQHEEPAHPCLLYTSDAADER